MNIIHHIVGRRIGKTTRLIEMVKDSKAKFNIIVVNNNSEIFRLKEIFNIENKSVWTDDNDSRQNINWRNLYKHGGTLITTYRNFCNYFNEYLPSIKNENEYLNIYFDELITMVDGNETQRNVFKITDYINSIENNFDGINSNIIAFSTPTRTFKLSEFVKWENGVNTENSFLFNHALMSTKYVSRKMPTKSNFEQSNTYNLKQLDMIGLDLFNIEVLGNYIK